MTNKYILIKDLKKVIQELQKVYGKEIYCEYLKAEIDRISYGGTYDRFSSAN